MQVPFLIKYKPQLLSDLYLDEKVFEVLSKLVDLNNLSIILIGDHGSCKTTIINAILNDYYLNIEKQLQNDNILYINSLKEQGIQYYRNELKIFCQSKSTINNKKKTIIIDDIDNINEASQQVLKNNLDKYIGNINFVISCVNFQKVLDGIYSRLLPIYINKIDDNNLLKIIDKITTTEKIKLNKVHKNRIIQLSEGSVQTIINYIEKIYLIGKNIDIELIENISTNIERISLLNLTNACIVEKNVEKGIAEILKIYNKGYSVLDILDDYFNYIKHCKKTNEELKYEIIKLICKYITIVNTVHDNELELCFFVNELTKLEVCDIKSV
tara:strand:+ start:152 stop:1132 length:981 start_codon:yes stop_codon:yes gene_type:complete